MNAGRLEIELLANMARLQSDMADAKRSVGGAMAGIESSVATAKNALVGLGVVGAVVTFAGTIKGAIDAADQINKLSQRTGIGVDKLDALRYAGKLADVEFGAMEKTLARLNVNIAKAAAGEEEQADAFKKMALPSSTRTARCSRCARVRTPTSAATR